MVHLAAEIQLCCVAWQVLTLGRDAFERLMGPAEAVLAEQVAQYELANSDQSFSATPPPAQVLPMIITADAASCIDPHPQCGTGSRCTDARDSMRRRACCSCARGGGATDMFHLDWPGLAFFYRLNGSLENCLKYDEGGGASCRHFLWLRSPVSVPYMEGVSIEWTITEAAKQHSITRWAIYFSATSLKPSQSQSQPILSEQ